MYLPLYHILMVCTFFIGFYPLFSRVESRLRLRSMSNGFKDGDGMKMELYYDLRLRKIPVYIIMILINVQKAWLKTSF